MPSTIAQAIQRPTAVNEKKMIAYWSIVICFVTMNTTMFSAALPSIGKQFALSPDLLSWIVTGYSITFSIASITYSRLTDYIPLRVLLTISLLVFGVSSLLGSFSVNFFTLMAVRILQAMGAGAIPSLAVLFTTKYLDESNRVKAISIITSTGALGMGVGPLIGGQLTNYLGWNSLFLFSSLILLVLPFMAKKLMTSPLKKIKFDFIGALFLSIGVISMLLFLSKFQYVYLIVLFVSLFLCKFHFQRHAAPFIQPSVLRNGRFLAVLFFAIMIYCINFMSLFLIPNLLHELYQMNAAEIGLLLSPGAIIAFFMGGTAARWTNKYGANKMIFAAHLFLTVSSLCMAVLSSISFYYILAGFIIANLGFLFLSSNLVQESSKILLKTELGAGTGILQLVQFLGGAFGVAMSGASITWQLGTAPDLIYRNIFLGGTALIIVSLLVFLFYYRKARRGIEYDTQ